MNDFFDSDEGLRAQTKRAAVRMFKLLVGMFLILLGLLSVPTPLPIGFLLTLVGLVVLASESPWVVPTIRWMRTKFPALDGLLRQMKDKMPRPVQGLIEATETAGPT
ncbi:MAG: hypothetical protein A2516_06175 [Alphaproteobacteria bacterium RIFOXYD12_FULL_60_8]|nr:MAG: hypothetical protein A2516_06175 [Alphaproteobacteria bacterium RIFOXYD12_FULL_60_8]